MAGRSAVGFHRTEGLAPQNVGNTLVLRTPRDAVWSPGLASADYQKKAGAGTAVCHHNRTTAPHTQGCGRHSADDGHSFEETGPRSLRSRICRQAAPGPCWLVSLRMGAAAHSSDWAPCLASALGEQQLAASKHGSVSSLPQDRDPAYIPV